eukprot:9475662-Pyramimonas_sp.AAC.1
MTSRYLHAGKFAKSEKGEKERTMRLRLVLRGSIDVEAFGVDTSSGTARRASQRLLAGPAACKKPGVMASMDIEEAFLQGLTYRELAEVTGEEERI